MNHPTTTTRHIEPLAAFSTAMYCLGEQFRAVVEGEPDAADALRTIVPPAICDAWWRAASPTLPTLADNAADLITRWFLRGIK